MKKETRGRKPLKQGQHKPPQTTLKINNAILPLVLLLKGNLKIGILSDAFIIDLMKAVNNKKLPFNQVTALTDADLSEQSKLVERLTAENLELNVRIKLAEKSPVNHDSQISNLKSELAKEKKNSGLREVSYHNLTSKREQEIKRLKEHHQCQKIKRTGDRCTKRGFEYVVNDYEIHLCTHHSKNI